MATFLIIMVSLAIGGVVALAISGALSGEDPFDQ